MVNSDCWLKLDVVPRIEAFYTLFEILTGKDPKISCSLRIVWKFDAISTIQHFYHSLWSISSFPFQQRPQEWGSNVKQLASSDLVIVLHIKICFKTWFELSDTWIIVKAFCNLSSALLHFETSIDKISNGLYSATNICKIRMTWIHQKLYCI